MTELGIELNDTSTELGIELDNLGADYNGLSNKPQVNGITLQGNKTGSQLGLANASDVYTKVEADTLLNAKADKSTTYTKSEADTLLNAKADKSTTYTKTETDTLLNAKVDKVNGKSLSTNDYTNEDKAKVQSAVQPSAISDMATKTWVNAQNFITNAVNNLLNYFTKTEVNTLLGNKQNTLVSGTNIKTINNQSVLGSGDIQVGGDVQSVNGKTGVVVLDAEDVGALPSTTAIPSKTSDLDNDSGFITNSVNNLTNYRLASAQDVIDLGLQTDIDNIESLIPSQATSSNKLADKNFVNSSIATSTATFRGTSATGLTEQQFIAWANTLTHDDNDYVFWNTTDTDGNVQFKRYKYDGTQWLYEYTLNNSSFTANQWATIQSGLSASDKTKLDGIESGAEVNTLEGVQINGNDLTITNKKVNIPYMSASTHGVARVGQGRGLYIEGSYGIIALRNADPNAIDERLAHGSIYFGAITPINFNRAVKAALSDSKRIGQGTVGTDGWAVAPLTDTEKQTACDVLGSQCVLIKTSMDSTAIPNTQYYLGTQSSVSLTLPSASAGQSISVVFYTGNYVTTLSISGSYLGTLPTPSTNQRIELNLLYDGTNWCLLSNVMGTE